MKGTSLKLPCGSTNADCVKVVMEKHGDAIRSPQGWYGVATVSVDGDGKGVMPRTVLVKVVRDGCDVYEKTGEVRSTVVVTTGELKSVVSPASVAPVAESVAAPVAKPKSNKK